MIKSDKYYLRAILAKTLIFLGFCVCVYVIWLSIPFIPKVIDIIKPLEQPRPDYILLDMDFTFGKNSFQRKYLYSEIGLLAGLIILNSVGSLGILLFCHAFCQFAVLE